MKKFVFTLQAVARYKDTVEKKQKAELSRVMAVLQALYQEQESIQQAMADCADSLERALAEQLDVVNELVRHDNYQIFLRDRMEETRQKIAAAEAEKKRIQALLIVTLKEQKALKRLRDEQYQAYLEEVRKEEALVIGDLISYSSTAEEAGQ